MDIKTLMMDRCNHGFSNGWHPGTVAVEMALAFEGRGRAGNGECCSSEDGIATRVSATACVGPARLSRYVCLIRHLLFGLRLNI